MSPPAGEDASHLLYLAQIALGTSQEGVGRVMGVSRRTMSRWVTQRRTRLYPFHAKPLARAVHLKDPALAARIAAAGDLTLAQIGLPDPAAQADEATAAVRADSVVCAAAEVLDASPRAVRPALLAAVRRAVALGLSLERLESTLAAAAAPPGGARRGRAAG